MSWTAKRYHDISCGHRVHGHEGKCANLHGHNYRIFFTCAAFKTDEELDNVGRVIDFSVIKQKLCMWLEDNWDHKMLMWEKDPLAECVKLLDPTVVIVSFNPTAENIAMYLVEVVGPELLGNTGVYLKHCEVEETRKCAATYEVE
jgi:6-pyruvoyltetrahydropterin/6-carboxytetrahydropterin synthase